jgi:hypothetical protein
MVVLLTSAPWSDALDGARTARSGDGGAADLGAVE